MERTAVFIDYQNVHLGAHELFAPSGQPVHQSLVDPLAVAERIADLVHTALREDYDVAVVFTNDTDILPAVELAFYETKPRVEIAAWQGAKPLWFPTELSEKRCLPFCHFLDARDFDAVRDTRSYL